MISCKFISQTIKCFGAGYESIWRKAHNIPELISSQQPRGPSMETWIKGSVQWLFTFLSLFLRHHQVAKAFITSAATAPLLPADGEEWTSTKKREEAVIKDRGSGTISAWDPTLQGPPVQERDLLLALCVTFFCTHKQLPTSFPCAVCTWVHSGGRQQTCCGRSRWMPKAKPFPMNNNSRLKNTHLTACLGDSMSEVLRQDQIKQLQGESWVL